MTNDLRPALPSTSAAPVSLAGGDPRSHLAMARELASDLEGRRRTLTLGGSLLLIPGSAGVTLALSAYLGVTGIWLPVCALAGLAIGLTLTTVTMAGANLLGAPAVRRRYRRQARALGLGEHEIEQAWQEALAELDAKTRARLAQRPDAMVAPALEERSQP